MDRNTAALKSGVWYIFANILVKGIAFITTPIFARLLTKEQYGDYSNYASWGNIAVIVVTMRMEASFISAKFDYKDRLDQYNYSLLCLTAVSTAAWTLVINIFADFFTEFFGMSLFYTNSILLYCFFHAVINVYQMRERFQYRYKRSVFVGVLVAFSATITSILLVMNMRDRTTGRVLGHVLPVLVIGMVLFVHFKRKGRRVDPSLWPYVLKVCIPYVPHLLSLTVLSSVDRIMIRRFCGAADVALYSIAYTCGHMATLLMTSMNGAFSPWLGDKLQEGSHQEIRKVSIRYAMLFCGLALYMMLLAPEILYIMGGKGYLSARYVMPPVAMGCACQFLYTLFVNVEQYKKKTVGMAFASVSAAALNYGLNLIFIPRFGYIAAAYTTLAGYFFLLCVHMFLVKRLGYGDVYSYRYILLLTAAMAGATLGVNWLYGAPVLRYIVLGCTCVVGLIAAWIKRDLVKRLLLKIIK